MSIVSKRDGVGLVLSMQIRTISFLFRKDSFVGRLSPNELVSNGVDLVSRRR